MAKAKTIKVDFESYFYLRNEMHNQRSETGKPLDKEWNRKRFMSSPISRDGYKLLMAGDLGGCKGNPKNAWEEGRWTSWTLEEMTAMLDVAGLPWSEGEEIEYMNI